VRDDAGEVVSQARQLAAGEVGPRCHSLPDGPMLKNSGIDCVEVVVYILTKQKACLPHIHNELANRIHVQFVF
jgi:hypothetical protein